MEGFPSDLELNAASALLLLTCQEFTSSNNSMSIMEENNEIEFEKELKKNSDALELSCLQTSVVVVDDDDDTTPCNSSLTNDDSVLAHSFKLMDAAAARCHELKLKPLQVARRARSKVVYRSFKSQKPTKGEDGRPKKGADSEITKTTSSSTTMTTTEGSCVSSGGSKEISSKRMKKEEGERKRRGNGGSSGNHIRRRAEAIMRLLSGGGCASEVRIRQILGDSPDTSKALRMLLKMDEVKRTGLGGRTDPFIYKIAAENGA